MRSLQLAMRGTLFLLSAVLAATCGHAADQATDPCASSGTLTSTNEDLQALYTKLQTLCAQHQINSISTQITNDKYSALLSALNGITSATVPGNSGAISNGSNADHIGQLHAQTVTLDAASGVWRAIGPSVGGHHFMFITDPADLKQHLAYESAAFQFRFMTSNLNTLVSSVEGTLGTLAPAPPAARGQPAPGRSSLAPAAAVILPLIPPLLTAAQALSGVFKSDVSLSALTVTAQPAVILAGLCAAGCSGLVLPNVVPTASVGDLQDDYGKLVTSGENARREYAKVQGVVDKAGGDEKASPAVIELRDALKSQVEEFDSLLKVLNTVPAGKATTPLQDLITVAQAYPMKILDNGVTKPIDGFLLVTTAQIGGHGGVRTAKWSFSGDKLTYVNTVALTYSLLGTDGAVLKSGMVTKLRTWETGEDELTTNSADDTEKLDQKP